MTSACCSSSSRYTSLTRAGLSALAIKRAGSGSHWIMSIFSLRSSETTARTRLPRGPTQAPTGSIPDSFDPPQVHERHPPMRLLDDTGHDVAHAPPILLEELLVVHLIEALVKGLAHHLGGDAGEVVGRYVLAVLHNTQVTRLLGQDHLGPLFGPFPALVSGEQRLFEDALHRLEGDTLVHLDLVQSR